MGKGDKKTRKGKISMGSYGVSRPRDKKTAVVTKVEKPAKKEVAPKKVAVKKTAVEKPVSEKKPAAKKTTKKKGE